MSTKQKTALIIGGTSGLGWALAGQLASDYQVIVVGRCEPQNLSEMSFYHLDLAARDDLEHAISECIATLPPIDLLVYAAGYYQEGTLHTLSRVDVANMISVGLTAPTLIVQQLLKKQQQLPGVIFITSTSQLTPRKLEPVYTAVKAGLGMLGNSLSLDDMVGKVFVAAPGGMDTPFWQNHDKDIPDLLDPNWVAENILEQYACPFVYRHVRMPRSPRGVEILETR